MDREPAARTTSTIELNHATGTSSRDVQSAACGLHSHRTTRELSMKTIACAVMSVLASMVWACGSSDTDGATEDGAGNEMNALASISVRELFAAVEMGSPKCYVKAYPAQHLSSHPKQTVSAIRLELVKGDP